MCNILNNIAGTLSGWHKIAHVVTTLTHAVSQHKLLPSAWTAVHSLQAQTQLRCDISACLLGSSVFASRNFVGCVVPTEQLVFQDSLSFIVANATALPVFANLIRIYCMYYRFRLQSPTLLFTVWQPVKPLGGFSTVDARCGSACKGQVLPYVHTRSQKSAAQISLLRCKIYNGVSIQPCWKSSG